MGKKPKSKSKRDEDEDSAGEAGKGSSAPSAKAGGKGTSAPSGSHFVSCERPSPRCHFSLTEVEPGRLLLFGGEIFNGRKFTCFQEVYELTLPQTAKYVWRRLELEGQPAPRARSAHQAVSWRGSLMVLGGEWADATQDKVQQFKDIWRLTLKDSDARWEQIAADKGFSQRSGHRACAHDGTIVVFGGYSDDADGNPRYLNDVHRFDLAQSKFKKDEDIGDAKPRERSAGQVWSDGKAVWLFGGSTPAPKRKGVKEHMEALGDLWSLDAGKWSGPLTVAGEGPGARSGISSAPYSARLPDASLRLFFGGVTDRFGLKKEEFSAFHNDAFVLDTKGLSWSLLDLQPGNMNGRIGAQLTPVCAPGRVETFILFGGMSEAGPKEITMDDLWCVAEIRDQEDTVVSKKWSCLVPLSSKTKTWFPDNDADSSDDAAEGNKTPHGGTSAAPQIGKGCVPVAQAKKISASLRQEAKEEVEVADEVGGFDDGNKQHKKGLKNRRAKKGTAKAEFVEDAAQEFAPLDRSTASVPPASSLTKTSQEQRLFDALLCSSGRSDVEQASVQLEEDKIPVMSDSDITSLITTTVPEANTMLDRLGEFPICHYICLSYKGGLPAQAAVPTLHLHTKLALRYILHSVSAAGEHKDRAVKILTALSEAYTGCQQIQARVIDSLFGTLTGRDRGLRGQLFELIDIVKTQTLDEVTFKLHPDCLSPYADMGQQMPHIQSGYISQCGETLGLRGVKSSSADRMKPSFNKPQIAKFIQEYRETFPVKEVVQNFVRDVNQVGETTDRTIDVNVLFKWCGEAKDDSGFDAQRVMYQEDSPDLYTKCGGAPPHDSAAAALCAPWLHYDLALEVLLLCFSGSKEAK